MRSSMLLALLTIVSAEPAIAAADLVFVNGAVHTMDSERRVVSALAIKGDRITALGNDSELKLEIGENTRVIDLSGQMLLPGLIDSHTHIGVAMDYTAACSLHADTSKDELIHSMQACVTEHQGDGWLWGFGFNVNHFRDVQFSRQELDELFPETPVAMVSLLHEVVIFNSAGIEQMKYGEEEGDADSPAFVRDDAGVLSGVGYGDAAVLRLGLFAETQPLPALRAEIRKLNQFGFTSFFDAGVFVDDYATRLLAFKTLDDQDALTVRANLSVIAHSPGTAVSAAPLREALQGIKKLRQHVMSERIRLDTLKIFVDVGAPFMVEPYVNSESIGAPVTPPEMVHNIVSLGTKNGFSTFMHVIGDGAARLGLDAIEKSSIPLESGTPRHTLSHLFLVHSEDLSRFEKLDVIANVTPVWAFHNAAGSYDLEESSASLGRNRAAQMLAFKDLADHGAKISSSSDYPFSSMNPFEGMEVGITRKNPLGGASQQPYNGNQSVTLDTMLMSYTANGAYQLGQENRLGTLEVGKLADLVVLDRNLYRIPVTEISHTEVVLTILGGVVVYER